MSEPIGPERAAKLEHHVKTVCGHPQPLHFCNSWFNWRVKSLAELTEMQGKELIEVATKKVAEWRREMEAEAKREAQNYPRTKICEACGATMTMAFSRLDVNNRPVYIPLDETGESHFKSCTDPKRFSRSSSERATG